MKRNSLQARIAQSRAIAAMPVKCPTCGGSTVQPVKDEDLPRILCPVLFRAWRLARCCETCGWENEESAKVRFELLFEN